jgi:hypothetical protein
MKVKILTVMSFKDGAANVGDEVEVDDAHAEELIRLGLAAGIKSKPETATVKPPEDAALPAGKSPKT